MVAGAPVWMKDVGKVQKQQVKKIVNCTYSLFHNNLVLIVFTIVYSVQNNSRTSVNFQPFHENDLSYCNMVGLAIWPLMYWTRWAAV